MYPINRESMAIDSTCIQCCFPCLVTMIIFEKMTFGCCMCLCCIYPETKEDIIKQYMNVKEEDPNEKVYNNTSYKKTNNFDQISVATVSPTNSEVSD